MARDFLLFRPAIPEIGSLETAYRIAKARHWRAFLRSVVVNTGTAALPGWRRSADRTRLRANSLLYRDSLRTREVLDGVAGIDSARAHDSGRLPF
jgi:hypothetical protein